MTLDLFQHEAEPHGGYRRSDPETSKAAGKAMREPKLTAIKQMIMEYFREMHEMTDEQLLGVIERDYGRYAFKDSTIRSRRAELVKSARLADSGKKGLTRSKSECIIWGLV